MEEDEVKRVDRSKITEGSVCHINEFDYIYAVMGTPRIGVT